MHNINEFWNCLLYNISISKNKHTKINNAVKYEMWLNVCWFLFIFLFRKKIFFDMMNGEC